MTLPIMLVLGIGGVALAGGALAVQSNNAKKAAQRARSRKHAHAKTSSHGSGGGHAAAASRPSAPPSAKPGRPVNGGDVAAYLIERLGPLSPMKIMRLAYLAQAANIAASGRLIYSSTFKAGPTGPMPTDLFERFKGKRVVDEVPDADTAVLDQATRGRIDEVVSRFGDLDDVRLNDIACQGPWQATRDAHLHANGVSDIDPSALTAYWNELTGAPST